MRTINHAEPSPNDAHLSTDIAGKTRLCGQPELAELGIKPGDIVGYWGCPNYVRIFTTRMGVLEIWA